MVEKQHVKGLRPVKWVRRIGGTCHREDMPVPSYPRDLPIKRQSSQVSPMVPGEEDGRFVCSK